MRGNEKPGAIGNQKVLMRFPIPMRGNELPVPGSPVCSRNSSFQSP